ncbi:MAG: hypothetical protein U0U66_01250 [Cytophagaceae bacterium]
MFKKIVFIVFTTLNIYTINAQDSAKVVSKKPAPEPFKPVKLKLNDDGSRFLQFTGLVQTWARYTDLNPGTTINGFSESNTFDVGIRRARFQMIGQLSDKVFFYSQVGMNSFSYLSERKYGFFIHDIIGEYQVCKKLSIGAGLNSWVGPLRFSSPSVGTIMGMDLPIFQQTTNDINDQFVRRLGIYGKGKIGKLDYRVSITKPFIVNYNKAIPIPGSQGSVPLLGALANDVSTFSIKNPNPQFNGYFMYQMKDQESDKTPYNVGSYLGAKEIFNIGFGAQYQKDAVWHKELNSSTGNIDTISTAYATTGVDVFYEKPLNKTKGNLIHVYASWLYSNYGKNYIRNFAPMNPADGGSAGYNGISPYNSGGGAAFPMNGTGNTFFIQAGYKFKKDLLGNCGTLMPYTMLQYSKFDALNAAVVVYDLGINWLHMGHNSKLSLNYQNRPYLIQTSITEPVKVDARKGMWVLQYQVSF